MWFSLIGCGIMLFGGIAALFTGGRNRLASGFATASIWLGCGFSAIPVLAALRGHPPLSLSFAWYLPLGRFSIAMDGLSAFFFLPILILSPLAALYGCGYLAHKPQRLGSHWFFFNLLVVSMMMLVMASNGILFLLSWEVMALSSFFLVIFDDERASVREAGWTYLVATHLGTAALLIFFALLGNKAGSFDFNRFTSVSALSSPLALMLFVLALVGFGSKAGVFPIHVWLPEAHPAAPSHVSALMSGVMIKIGIYGLLRAIGFLGPPPAIWGWTLVVIGLASGILGVISALAQHNLKRLLAYHSVENIGIIVLGLGVGFLGLSWQVPVLAVCGFGGGLLHVLNHAIFKGLLFLGAGAALHRTGTGEMDELGGLAKLMPWTGGTFLIGAAAICALPPLNGFVSELLIYLAGINGVMIGTNQAIVLSAGLFAGLALIGGLAVACFTKCFGLVFLGEPRTSHVRRATEVGGLMIGPMVVLSGLCIIIGLAAPWVIDLLTPGLEVIMTGQASPGSILHGETDSALTSVALVAAILIAVGIAFGFVRHLRFRRRRLTTQGVWDCGYAAPTAHMQYTTSSFAQPLTDLFRGYLRTRVSGKAVNGFFPKAASFSSHTPDLAREGVFAPLFRLIARCLSPFQVLQYGRVHLYAIYVALTLVALLIATAGE